MTSAPISLDDLTFKSAFDADREVQQYRKLALALFALSLYLRIENIHEFAADAITEGGDDKKIDLCYLDEEEGRIIIAQSYNSLHWDRLAAPANKASDLNTAIAWLFSVNKERIPERIKSKAVELRNAINSGNIKRIEILFIHNCPESENVSNELKTVADATRDIIKSSGKDSIDKIVISYKEFGLKEIEDLYRSRDSEILVDEWLDVPVNNYIEEQGDGWKAIVTSASGEWIRQLYEIHRDRLFSANFRDYLGSINRKGNINLEIKQTAASEPVNFWVYNNGITALTHEIRPVDGSIRIHGISIINGAQTSGALGESAKAFTKDIKVLCRLVESRPQGLIQKIIRYNNTQNEIKPADRRSNDAIQTRLRDDFVKYKITYIHRRSATRTPRNAITASSIAPSLCAFHGDPQTAYRNAKEIFNSDDIYDKVFRSNVSVEHIYLIATLSYAIDSIKNDLKDQISKSKATQLQIQEYEVLRYSPSKHFILFIVGNMAEEIMNRRVTDLHEWKCKTNVISESGKGMKQAWADTLQALLPQTAFMVSRMGSPYDIQRSSQSSSSIARELKALLASLEPTLGSRFSQLRNKTTV